LAEFLLPLLVSEARLSAGQIPGKEILPVPDGTIDATDRKIVGGLYGGPFAP